MLYPQNGDRIVAIDSVTSLHPMYISCIGTLSFATPGYRGRLWRLRLTTTASSLVTSGPHGTTALGARPPPHFCRRSLTHASSHRFLAATYFAR